MVAASKLVPTPLGEQESRMYERHYSPAELAELWNLSADCVRKIFENEPGVLVIGCSKPLRGKQPKPDGLTTSQVNT